MANLQARVSYKTHLAIMKATSKKDSSKDSEFITSNPRSDTKATTKTTWKMAEGRSSTSMVLLHSAANLCKDCLMVGDTLLTRREWSMVCNGIKEFMLIYDYFYCLDGWGCVIIVWLNPMLGFYRWWPRVLESCRVRTPHNAHRKPEFPLSLRHQCNARCYLHWIGESRQLWEWSQRQRIQHRTYLL